MFQTSLRAKLLGLIAGSLLVLLCIALLCTQLLSRQVSEFAELLDGPIRESQLIEQVNLEFKTQVQEWKNVLLRGQDDAQRTRYWQQFQDQEAKVQRLLGELLQQVADDPALSATVSSLRDEHGRLGQAYRQGLDAFAAAGNDPRAGDRAVAGIDRATSSQLSELVDKLAAKAAQSSSAIRDSAETAALAGPLLMLIASVLVALLSLWLVNRNLIAPIGMLIGHVTELSHGRFGARLDVSRRDELGQLARAANTLRDFLADTFAQLRKTFRRPGWRERRAERHRRAEWPGVRREQFTPYRPRSRRRCTRCPRRRRRSPVTPPKPPRQPTPPMIRRIAARR